MVDKSISMDVGEVLELEYVLEQISSDKISFDKNPSNTNELHVSSKKFIFDPDGTGTHEIEIDGQIVEITVTDVPASGVSRWTFDDADTDTGTALDSWGSNDGTIYGATTGVSGANQTYATGEAYSFDGTNDYV